MEKLKLPWALNYTVFMPLSNNFENNPQLANSFWACLQHGKHIIRLQTKEEFSDLENGLHASSARKMIKVYSILFFLLLIIALYWQINIIFTRK